jgi:hypothetical protein
LRVVWQIVCDFSCDFSCDCGGGKERGRIGDGMGFVADLKEAVIGDVLLRALDIGLVVPAMRDD